MARDTDFLALYEELGVRPDCEPDDLRKAYRRRVGQLHPDRQLETPEGTLALQRLNALYDAAMTFQRNHGRLPGSTLRTPPRSMPIPPGIKPRPDVRRGSSRRRLVLLFLAFILLAVAVLYFAADEISGDGAMQSLPLRTRDVAVAVPEIPSRQVTLGMPAEHVLVVQGEPVTRSESLWEYGPSWISFECGEVSDWYSSAMRPLKTASASAPPKLNSDAVKRAADECRRSTLARAAGAIP